MDLQLALPALEAVRQRPLPQLDAEAVARNLDDGGDPQAARRAAEDFEAVFLSQMLAPMFAGIKTDALFGGGPAEDIYRSLLVEEYGKAISRAGGIGIADQVQREILALQEASSQ